MHLLDQELNLMIRGKFDEAFKLCEKLEEIDPNDLRHQFNKGWFLIHQGNFQEGFKYLESGRFLNVYGGNRLPTNKPIWKQQDLTNKTVILNSEGGYGDNIIHVRFANEIQKRGGKAIVCCVPELFSLFSRVPGVHKCIGIYEVKDTPHDYWIPGFSAGWLFGHTFDTLPNSPYIFSYPESVKLWEKFLTSKKIKVGIRWSGSPKFEHQQFRTFPPEPLIDLYKYDELQLYSLQRDNDTRELPEEIIDLQHFLISWEDTAAAIQNMDLIITSCTSIAHLSSAMGKPTWVIVPILPYHIWAYGENHTPWYQNTTKIFRQEIFGQWTEPFEKIENELIEKFDLKK